MCAHVARRRAPRSAALADGGAGGALHPHGAVVLVGGADAGLLDRLLEEGALRAVLEVLAHELGQLPVEDAAAALLAPLSLFFDAEGDLLGVVGDAGVLHAQHAAQRLRHREEDAHVRVDVVEHGVHALGEAGVGVDDRRVHGDAQEVGARLRAVLDDQVRRVPLERLEAQLLNLDLGVLLGQLVGEPGVPVGEAAVVLGVVAPEQAGVDGHPGRSPLRSAAPTGSWHTDGASLHAYLALHHTHWRNREPHSHASANTHRASELAVH